MQADLTAAEIGLVDPEDGHRAGFVALVRIGDGGAEKNLVAVGLAARIDHLGDGEALFQEADAAVDLAQAFLAVEVVAVFRAVAIAGGPGHDLDYLWAFDAQQGVPLRA